MDKNTYSCRFDTINLMIAHRKAAGRLNNSNKTDVHADSLHCSKLRNQIKKTKQKGNESLVFLCEFDINNLLDTHTPQQQLPKNVCMCVLTDPPESLAEPWSLTRLGRPGTACVVRYQTAWSTSVAWTLL